jgi:hypothetical protein
MALETNVTTLAFSNTTSGNVALTEVAAGGGFTVGSVATISSPLATSSNAAAGGTVTLIASSPIVFAVNTTSAGTLTAQALEVAGAGRRHHGERVGDGPLDGRFGGVRGGRQYRGQRHGPVGLGEYHARLGIRRHGRRRRCSTLNGTLTASSGTVTIDLNAESGDATQGAAGTITASVLALLATGGGTGAYVLAASTTNNVGTLTASVGGGDRLLRHHGSRRSARAALA